MRPSRFTDDEIRQALAQVRSGAIAVHVCRELGVTQTTFYRWRKKYEHLDQKPVDEQEEWYEARDLRDENRKLKRIIAELVLVNDGARPFRTKHA